MSRRALHPNQDIAIVGAGVSGLLLARELRLRGFERVTLYEAGPAVAGSTQDQVVDGRAYDFATKFVPADTLVAPGVFAPLQALLDELDVDLTPSPDPFFYDPATRRPTRTPALFAGHRKSRILRDFVRAFDLLVPVATAGTVDALFASGLVHPTETIQAWGKRLDVPIFADFLAFLSDMFSGGRSVAVSAAYLLKSRVHFLAGFFKKLFCKTPAVRAAVMGWARAAMHPRAPEGVRLDHPDVLLRFLRAPLQPFNNHVCQGGYKQVFARLVERWSLDVRVAHPVTALHRDAAGWTLQFAGPAPARADAVVVSCPPWALSGALPADSPWGPLLAQVPRPSRDIQTWLFRGRGWPARCPSQGILLDGPNRVGFGTAGLRYDGRPGGVSRETHDNDVLAVPVYRSLTLTDDQAQDQLRQGMQRDFGITVTEILGSHRFAYPRAAPLDAIGQGWFERVASAQGDQGMFLVGEVLSGPNVPTTLQGVQAFAEQHVSADSLRRAG